MLFEIPVLLFIIASLTAIVIFLLMVLLNISQKKSTQAAEEGLENLKRFLLVDPSTGAYNQGFFVKKLEEESYRAARYDVNFTVVVYDFEDALKNLESERAASIYRKLVVTALRDTRFSDFVATLRNYAIGVIFSMTPKASSEVPINRLLQKFSDILRQEGIEGKPEISVFCFPENKTEIEKLISELKE